MDSVRVVTDSVELPIAISVHDTVTTTSSISAASCQRSNRSLSFSERFTAFLGLIIVCCLLVRISALRA